VLYADEAAYMDSSIFRNVIVPIYQRRDTALLMISTLSDNQNYYSELLRMKDEVTGQPLGNVFYQTLGCDVCLERGNEFAASCTHRLSERPPWLDPAKLSSIATLFGKRRDLFLREIQGIVGVNETLYFDTRFVDSLAKREFYDPSSHPPPRFVHVTIDPNAGGASNVAIVAAYRAQGRMVVRTSPFGERGRSRSLSMVRRCWMEKSQ
jgi:hypothetical protein